MRSAPALRRLNDCEIRCGKWRESRLKESKNVERQGTIEDCEASHRQVVGTAEYVAE